jgi:hypothetical protein
MVAGFRQVRAMQLAKDRNRLVEKEDSSVYTEETELRDFRRDGQIPFKNSEWMLGVVAHFCNPSHSGGGDWKDHGSRSL